jgi:hypothetical protein
VLRLSASSGEGGVDEEPIVRSELETVREKIVKAESKLAKYEAWFEKEEKGVTAAMVDTRVNTLNLLLAEKERLELASAPSCATGVVRKHFLKGGRGVVEWRVSPSFGPCNLNRVEGRLSSGVSPFRFVHVILNRVEGGMSFRECRA